MELELESEIADALEEKKLQKHWGVSTSLDLYDCNADLIRSEVHIREYVEKLCQLLCVKTYGACHVVHNGESVQEKGFSMFQLIETSFISAHFVNETNSAYIDICCSKPYDEEKIAIMSQDFFEAGYRHIQKRIRR